jgi:biotin carboxyl carrier protein
MRRYTIKLNETVHTIDVEETAHDQFTVHLADGRLVDATLVEDRDLAQALIAPSVELGEPRSPGPGAGSGTGGATGGSAPGRAAGRPSARPRGAAGRDVLTAPMPGVVLSVEVSPGTAVSRGQTLLVLEAMKMKNDLMAETDGVVARVAVAAGDQVRHGDLLVEFEG